MIIDGGWWILWIFVRVPHRAVCCEVAPARDCGPDMFCISERGRNILELTQTFKSPMLFAKFRLHDAKSKADFADMVPFEAMLELTQRSWTYSQRKASRKLEAYKRGGQKIWYFNTTVCRHYLQVLLSSDSLFEQGLDEIAHFQPTAYYKTLLFMLAKDASQLKRVKPWQTLSFYTVLRQQVLRRRAPKHADAAHNVDLDIEVERGRIGLIGPKSGL